MASSHAEGIPASWNIDDDDPRTAQPWLPADARGPDLPPSHGALLWRFDLNPKDSVYERGGLGTKSAIVATPVTRSGHVFVGIGDTPELGGGPGALHRIDIAGARGDITETRGAWRVGDDRFHRTTSTVAVTEDLVFAADIDGHLLALDRASGRERWRHDTESELVGSPVVVDGKVYLGTVDGFVHVLAASEEKRLLAINDVAASVYATPVAAGHVLYIATMVALYAISSASPPAEQERTSP